MARELDIILGRPVIHLGYLRWLPGQYGMARDNQLDLDEVAEAGKTEIWVMEACMVGSPSRPASGRKLDMNQLA